ncbi:MAG TPA: SpvB/TcaC N-terminal domain-containing protein, partial [Verrucomicrobiae bacterium]|nr:SpvB/TcaC N-terminal domain-containing protein [Verrucomicrobiae bacterium]
MNTEQKSVSRSVSPIGRLRPTAAASVIRAGGSWWSTRAGQVGLTFLIIPFLALAADKNGVSPNAISLPTGPGSIEGLGDSFQPALNSGTMRHGLSLHLPPGTAGHTPGLGFHYEGGQGNGPLGIGWSVPLPFIQRQTDKGIPRYVDTPNNQDDDRDGQVDEPDELDTFITDSKEELVPLANGNYFCKNEDAFIRYRKVGAHWEGTLPNGTKREFGLSDSGRITDNASTNRVFKWLLERVTDTRGNTIVYEWASFPGSTNLNQKYLREIRYGPGAPPWSHFHFASFVYQERPDWFEDCRSGYIVRTARRLAEVTIGTQGVTPAGHAVGDFNQDGQSDVLNRKYRLTYLNDVPGQPHWSLLHLVTQVGADNVSTLPPARFDYSICNPPAAVSVTDQIIGGRNEPPFAMDNANVELADLNGDGLPDLLRTGAAGGAHIAFLNRGEQSNGLSRVIEWGPATQHSSADGLAWNITLQSATDVASLSDMNGDGLADLVYKSALGDVFFFANQGTAGWGSRQLMSPQDIQPPAPF